MDLKYIDIDGHCKFILGSFLCYFFGIQFCIFFVIFCVLMDCFIKIDYTPITEIKVKLISEKNEQLKKVLKELEK